MDNKTLWTVIVTALIVAVLTSLITVKLSGSVVSLPTVYPSPANYTSVYTKAEIDSKFANVKANSCNADGNCEVLSLSSFLVTPSGFTKNITAYPGELRVSDSYSAKSAKYDYEGITFRMSDILAGGKLVDVVCGPDIQGKWVCVKRSI